MVVLDLDVANDESVSTVVQQVIDRFGRLDVLVNNAGIGTAGAAEESSVAQDQRLVNIKCLRRHPHDEGRPATDARPGKWTHHQHSLRYGFIPQPYMAA